MLCSASARTLRQLTSLRAASARPAFVCSAIKMPRRKAKEQDAEAAGDPAPAVADAPGAKRPKRERKAAAPPASDSTASEEEAQAAPSKAKAKAPRKRAAKKSAEPAADGAEGQEDAEAGSSKCAPLNVTGLWLMKNEPDELSLESLKEKPDQTAYWDGVRNYQARNFMRQMKIGDQILFYYSSCKVPGVAGIAKVVKLAYPDHTAWDPKSKYYDAKSTEDKPRWDMVDVQYVSHLPRFVTLTELRQHSKPGGSLEGMPLFTRFRLSVMPLEQRYWDAIVNMANEPGPESEDKK